LSRRPQTYGAMVLSLQSVYREELSLIATVKVRFPQVEIWLTDTDGRQASLADAMRLGADGLLGNDGLHRVAMAGPTETRTPSRSGGPKRNGKAGRSRRSRANHAVAEPPRPAEPPPFLAAAPPAASAPKPVAPAAAPPVRAARHERPKNGGAAGVRRSRSDVYDDPDPSTGDAVLTAEELRALLHEQPE